MMAEELLRQEMGMPAMPTRPTPGVPEADIPASTARGAGQEQPAEAESPAEVQAAHKRCPPVDGVRVPSMTMSDGTIRLIPTTFTDWMVTSEGGANKNSTHLKWVMSLRYAALSAAMIFTSTPVESNLIDPQNAEELLSLIHI